MEMADPRKLIPEATNLVAPTTIIPMHEKAEKGKGIGPVSNYSSSSFSSADYTI